MKHYGVALAALALAACAPTVPDSNPESGVGFRNYSDYNSYRAAPAAPPSRTTVLPPAADSTTTVPPPATTPPPAASAAAAAPPASPAGISDENNFAAVSDRESIESDAARLKAQRDAFEAVAPTAVPTRTGSEGPNIVEYALTTKHGVGTQLYRRISLFAGNKAERNCARYASADLAQEAFLQAGGPERDRLGLDPDGDGYACAWDPSPFRRISG